MEDFCVTSLRGLYLEGLIHGGAYFRKFTVCRVFIGRMYVPFEVSRQFSSPSCRFAEGDSAENES